MGTPLTKVPLKLSRSSTRQFPASQRMRQWRRETEGSLMWTAFAGSRPTDTSPPDTAKTVPLVEPEMAMSRGFIRARAERLGDVLGD
jgi:hypothetical protein